MIIHGILHANLPDTEVSTRKSKDHIVRLLVVGAAHLYGPWLFAHPETIDD
jgi:hypothetical protein